MVRSRCDPIIPGGERRPLHVDNEPGQPMATKSARGAVRRVQVDDGKTLGTIFACVNDFPFISIIRGGGGELTMQAPHPGQTARWWPTPRGHRHGWSRRHQNSRYQMRILSSSASSAGRSVGRKPRAWCPNSRQHSRLGSLRVHPHGQQHFKDGQTALDWHCLCRRP